MNALWFKPPPVKEPERLAIVHRSLLQGSTRTYIDVMHQSDVDALRLADEFADVAAELSAEGLTSEWRPLLTLQNDSSPLEVAVVSPDYFRTLGVSVVGPGFENSSNVGRHVLISESLWKTKQNKRRDIVGSELRLAGITLLVSGIVPASFRGPLRGDRVDVWVPLAALPGLVALPPGALAIAPLRVYVRPRQGVDVAHGEATVARILSQPVELRSLSALSAPGVGGEAGMRTRQLLLVILAISLVVLLLGCVNAAGLLLARTEARWHDFAVMLALGIPRTRLVRMLVADALILGGLGATAAFIVSAWLLNAVGAIRLPNGLALETLDTTIDWRVAAVGYGAALIAVLLAVLAPVWRYSAPSLASRLIATQHLQPPGVFRWLAGLQAAHVTLTVVLLACAFLMIRSVRAGLTTELGFAADQVIYLFVQPRLGQHATDTGDLDTTRRQNDYQRLVERIREIPTVERATYGVSPYLRQAKELRPKELRLGSTSHSLRMVTVPVGPEFFQTLGIPVIAGRDFDRTDIGGSGAAIISEALAASISPGRLPIGETIVVNGGQRLQIVGLAGDALRAGFDDGVIPAVYTAAPIRSEGIGLGVVVRTKGDAHRSMAAVLDVTTRIFPRPVQLKASTARDDMREELASQRLSGWLFGVFAFIAVALSLFGMYGLVISRILRRTRELAIRLALGATTDGLMVRAVMDAFVPVLFGCCAGLVLAAMAGRSLNSYLIGVAPHDLVALSAAAMTLMLPTIAAAATGALRLRRVDPAVMLRE